MGSESLMSTCNRKLRVLITTNALHYSLYIFFEYKCFNQNQLATYYIVFKQHGFVSCHFKELKKSGKSLETAQNAQIDKWGLK